jgi:hypothetical protein
MLWRESPLSPTPAPPGLSGSCNHSPMSPSPSRFIPSFLSSSLMRESFLEPRLREPSAASHDLLPRLKNDERLSGLGGGGAPTPSIPTSPSPSRSMPVAFSREFMIPSSLFFRPTGFGCGCGGAASTIAGTTVAGTGIEASPPAEVAGGSTSSCDTSETGSEGATAPSAPPPPSSSPPSRGSSGTGSGATKKLTRRTPSLTASIRRYDIGTSISPSLPPTASTVRGRAMPTPGTLLVSGGGALDVDSDGRAKPVCISVMSSISP